MPVTKPGDAPARDDERRLDRRLDVVHVGGGDLFVIDAYRLRERGDTIFLDVTCGVGMVRLAVPPMVAFAIARRLDAANGQRAPRLARGIPRSRRTPTTPGARP